MRITKVTVEKLDLRLRKPLTIAFQTWTSSATAIVRIDTDAGLAGFGEACGQPLITGDTIDSCVTVAKLLGQAIVGMDPLAIASIHAVMDHTVLGNSAAKAGIDIGVHDLVAKQLGVPLYRYLGGCRAMAETDITVGINPVEEMVEDARAVVAAGFRAVKIKIGTSPDHDVEVIRRLREALGPDVLIRVDANQAYSVADAVRTLNRMAPSGIDLAEQPIKAWDLAGLREIRGRITIPLFADESVHSPQDAAKLAAMGAVDGLNIKLMKSGGLYRALQIAAIGEAAGLSLGAGCMPESKIGLTAVASLVASQPLIARANLDADYFIEDHPAIAGGAQAKDGCMVCPEKPGLGIDVLM